MTTEAAPPPEYAPIFEWDAPKARKVSLFGFIAASALLHALCFYIFQIIYPPTVALLPPPARVNLITGDSEEGRLLWRWVEAEDPALSSTTQRPADAGLSLLPNLDHIPSYSGYRPALKQLPPYQPDLRIPSSQPPGPVRLPSRSQPTQEPVVASNLRFAGEGRLFGRPQIPGLKFSTTSDEPPASAQFRIAISPRGAVQHCFLDTSSGNPALDEQARRVLLLCRFPARDQTAISSDQLLWTTAVLEWGNDINVSTIPATEPPVP